jgi:hypothetical protein
MKAEALLPAPGLLPLFSWIKPIQPGGKDFLRLRASQRQGDAFVWVDGVFAQS